MNKKNIFCPHQDLCKDECFGDTPCSYEAALEKMRERIEELEKENRKLKEENKKLKRK